MKKYLSIEVIYKLFVILAVSVIVFALNSEVFASNDNPTEGNPTIKANPETGNVIWADEAAFEKWQFEQAQFLTRVNYVYAQEFMWLCDNSAYIPTIYNWNLFIRNYKKFQDAKRAINRGFYVELDELLN